MSGTRPPSIVGRARRAALAGLVRTLTRLYRLYHRTLRLHGLMPDGRVIHDYGDFGETREIVAMCERDALVFAGFTAYRGYVTLVANGRDGEWATWALEAMGFEVVRGASGRGGVVAGRELAKRMQESAGPAAMVVDGPLGPSGVAKPGVAWCAERSGRPMRPIAAAARHALVFRSSWSQVYLPLPFSRLVVGIGEPVMVGGSSAEDRAAATELLTERLAEARQRALDVIRAG